MTSPQRADFGAIAVILALGQRDETQQGIRNAAARRKHDTQAGSRDGIENCRDTAEAVGVSNARPPEFVHDPGIDIGHRSEFFRKKGRAMLLTSLSARNEHVRRLRA
jgi:hypothetical protein